MTPLTHVIERTPVTCPELLRERPTAAEFLGDVSRGRHLRAAVRAVLARLRRDDTLAQFLRFVLVGGSSTVVYAVLFTALQGLGYLPANIAATVVSSVMANEMHRRLTFRADAHVSFWSAQVEAGGVSLFGLVATSLALGWLDVTVGSAHVFLQITLVAAVTGLIGLIRFVALRWIFRPTGAPAAR